MAKAATRKSSGGFRIRRVETKEDRKRPSVFMRLKVDEAFKAVALFEPDPELKDNPGYFEYYDHFDQQANSYVPCAGEKCPFCAANLNPSTRALTAWYFPQAGDVKDRIKVFTMNFGTTQDITDESEDEDGIIGKTIRIKRLEPAERGNYKVKVTTDKPLTKAQLKTAMAELETKFPDGLEALVERQLKVQMERLKAMDALEDDDEDDDEEEEETPRKARRGKEIPQDEDEDDEEEDEDEEESEDDEESEDEEEDEEQETDADSIEDAEVEILRLSRKNNSIFIDWEDEQIELVADEDELPLADYSKGDVVTVSAFFDEDEESWSLTAISAEGEGEDEEESDDESISGGVYEVVKVQEKDEIFDLTDDAGEKIKMWLGDGLNVDYDVVKKGTKITVDAVQDDEGDWIIVSLEPVKPARRRAAAKPKPRTRRATK